jgi:hypothetical protein
VDHRRAIEVLVEIERRADVNALRAGGLCVWPLVRLRLWEQLLKPMPGDGVRSPRSTLRFPPWSALQRWRARQRLRELPRADALFLSRAEDHADCFEGRHYNRHVDPLLGFCRGRLSSLKLEPLEPAAKQTTPRAEPTHFFEPNRLAELPPLPVIEGMSDLRSALAALESPPHLDESAVRREAAQLFRWREAYREVLAVVQPRVVFVVCYYDRRVLPLIAACRERGIPTVDIQHGKQGVAHGLYTHWTRIPAGGYALLPDFFWVWGEPSRRHIKDSRPAPSAHHRPIVGGNRWLALWRSGAAFPLPPAEAAWLDEARRAERTILVTLQPIEPMLPPHLRAAMERSPAGWLWLLRAHPHRRAEIPALLGELRAAGSARYEGERASTVPLYALLRVADRHLTCWSSVAHEAPAFHVPTMIVHANGAQLYATEIASGHFAYAENADAVLAWIAGEKPNAVCGDRYIETGDDLAEAALSAVLAHSQGGGAPPPRGSPRGEGAPPP